MKELLHNIRFYILLFSLLFSLAVNAIIIATIPSSQLQTIRLNQIYGLASFVLLYLAVVAGPFCYMFANFPWKKQYLKARRALGVSAFYFAALHAVIAFFGQLEGFAGLGFLSTNYQIALGTSAIALFILLLQALTSVDAIIKKMTFPRWKILQRFVYLAGILVLVHIVLLGTHYADLSAAIPKITFLALAFLFFLEGLRIDAWLQQKFHLEQKFSYGSLGIGILLILGALYLFTPFGAKNPVSLATHSQHPMQMNTTSNAMNSSMQGDRSLRYNVRFDKQATVQPNADVTLSFAVSNAANGNDVSLFQKLYEKEAHLVIVDNSLQYFNHLHPQRSGNTFTITKQFPKPGVYRAYLTYQPIGAVEQQVGFRFVVGTGDTKDGAASEQKIDTQNTKTFGQYEVTMDTAKGLTAKEMTSGAQTLTFTLRNAVTKKTITTLQPYLGAFGHLVMIHEGTYSYIHVHPQVSVTQSNQDGGPGVTFVPMTLTEPIKPGVYKIFAEFNPDGNHIVADFKIWVY